MQSHTYHVLTIHMVNKMIRCETFIIWDRVRFLSAWHNSAIAFLKYVAYNHPIFSKMYHFMSSLIRWDVVILVSSGNVLGIWICGCGCSLFSGFSKSVGAHSTTLITLLRIPYLCHFGSTSFVLPIQPKYSILLIELSEYVK